MGRFPTDETTLTLLVSACQINPDTGRSHLREFLSMGATETSRTLIAGDEDGGDSFDTAPVYEVEYPVGQEPFTEHEVIVALVEEIQQLRGRELKRQWADEDLARRVRRRPS